MSIKQAIINHNGENIAIFFPFVFKDEIVSLIKYIRMGGRNWSRPWVNSDVSITSIDQIPPNESKQKYIVLHKEDHERKDKFMFIFPKEINHDDFLEIAQSIVFKSKDLGYRPVNCFSAGFISTDGICYGSSESIGIGSHQDDTALFLSTFKPPMEDERCMCSL